MNLSDLLEELGRSDALDPRTPYDVLVNQFGHCSVGLFSTLILVDCGAPLGWAMLLAVVLWAGLWEGLQYAREAVLYRRIRRRWDWATDGAAYLTGALAAWPFTSGWTIIGVAAIMGMIAVAAYYWGDK